MRLDLLLLGYREFAVAEAEAPACLDALQTAGISPKRVKRYRKTGEIGFTCNDGEAKRLPRSVPSLREIGAGGVPVWVWGAGKRPGLVCGILIAVLMITVASLVVWDIDIVGNEQIAAAELEEAMRTAGVTRGSWLYGVDTGALAISLREADSRLSYVAINRKGTVLEVQIRESVTPQKEAVKPANLVAKSDGVITLPLIFEGECLVSEGEVVRAGQLLASGVIDSEKHGYRVTRAAGQVLARTTRVYEIRVPFADREKQYTDRDKWELTLFFFDFRQKVFKSTGNYNNNCDIIENIKWVILPTGHRLPVGICMTTYRFYEYGTVLRSATLARALALAELEERLAADSAGRTMLEKHIEMRADEEGITLICTVIAEEDIALVREFDTVNPSS